MMSLSANWLAAPIVIPALTAALSFLFNRLGNARAVGWQYLLALLGALANLAVGITLLTITLGGQRVVLQMGTYPAPFGISFVADGLSATMLTLTGILAFATILYARGTLDQRDRLNFYPLALLLVTTLLPAPWHWARRSRSWPCSARSSAMRTCASRSKAARSSLPTAERCATIRSSMAV